MICMIRPANFTTRSSCASLPIIPVGQHFLKGAVAQSVLNFRVGPDHGDFLADAREQFRRLLPGGGGSDAAGRSLRFLALRRNSGSSRSRFSRGLSLIASRSALSTAPVN